MYENPSYGVGAVIVLGGKLERKKDQFLVRPASKRNWGQGPTQYGLKEEQFFCWYEDNIQSREKQAKCKGMPSQEESEVSVLGQDDSWEGEGQWSAEGWDDEICGMVSDDG